MNSSPLSKARLAAIEALPEAEIDTSDIPEMGEEFFAAARLVLPPTGGSDAAFSSAGAVLNEKA